MEKMILAAMMVVTLNAQAAILNSDLDSVHQRLITESVAKNCYLKGDLSQLNIQMTVETIDQGVHDVHYTTSFETFDKYDQVISDKYIVTVKSVKWDMYDHENKIWGAYSVESVNCQRAE